MVHNTIHATYTETYDLNTINNELSLLAIHTPQAPQLKRMFKGFFEQYKKFKILGCNFKMVCASQQALDPTMVGMGTGQMDPRDVLNPILFKACTGEGMNVLLDQIYNKSEDANHYTGFAEGSVHQHIDTVASQTNAYYSLLADDSFRREHPQRGITVMGLKPMVHKVVTTQPFKWSGALGGTSGGSFAGDRPYIGGDTVDTSGTPRGFGGQSGSNNGTQDPVNPSVFVSNGLCEMPWLDTAFSKVCTFRKPGEVAEDKFAKAYVLCQNVPRVYMGCMILPPSQALNLYYRLQVVWHIAFRDFRPAQDLLPIDPSIDVEVNVSSLVGDNPSLGIVSNYWNMYHTPSKLTKDYGSIDTTGVESVEIVNEKVN